MEADPRLMKADIAPLLDHITPEVIQDILEELHTVGLIILYEAEDMQYLQIVKFDENQPNLRKDREKKSQIPKAPAESKPKKTPLRQDSGEAPAEVPHKINIREDNIREAKATPEEAAPVDNSQKVPDPPQVKNAFLKDMEKEFSDVMGKIKDKYDYKQRMEIENWMKANYRGKHPQAIIHTLNALNKTPDVVRDITKYLDKIIIMENQNYNYNDYQRKVEEFKKPGMFSIVDIFKGIQLQMPAAAH